jgi:GTP cyclohydrolase I
MTRKQLIKWAEKQQKELTELFQAADDTIKRESRTTTDQRVINTLEEMAGSMDQIVYYLRYPDEKPPGFNIADMLIIT